MIFDFSKLIAGIAKLFDHISKKRAAVVLSAAFAVLSVLLFASGSGVRLCRTVRYSDRIIAVVNKAADYKAAGNIVASRLDNAGKIEAVERARYGITLSVSDNISSTGDIVKAIIESDDDIIESNALVINGKTAIYIKSESIKGVLESAKNRFNIKDARNESEFTDKVELKKEFCRKSELSDMEEAQKIISELKVRTVSVVSHKTEIPYETKNEKTKSEPIGYSAVTTEGENGLKETVECLVSFNGAEESRATVSDEVIKEPVTRVVTVGTGSAKTSATQKSKARSAGFIVPIESGRFTVSGGYGDGRNHKGIDLAADAGTPIFAVASGKVIYAGFRNDFGYSIIIDHGNGVKTRYAHAKAFCVSEGDTVNQGDMIATVGRTGWATGNHLHFEVIINGNRVDPAPYIGL